MENWKVPAGHEVTHPASVSSCDKKKSDSHAVQLMGEADVQELQLEEH